MKKDFSHLERYRTNLDMSSPGDTFGMFLVPVKEIRVQKKKIYRCLSILCTDGLSEGEAACWEHVSAKIIFSRMNGTFEKVQDIPTWAEMCRLKDLFFEKNETVVQYHPAEEDYVNFHPFVLHLWRHTYIPFPKPPTILIGPKI